MGWIAFYHGAGMPEVLHSPTGRVLVFTTREACEYEMKRQWGRRARHNISILETLNVSEKYGIGT